MKKIAFLAVLMFAFLHTFSQSIISVAPSSVVKGSNSTLLIRGMGTHFQNGVTQIAPVDGITISSVSVLDNLSLSANITVLATATPGNKTITVKTNNETVTSSIQVVDATGQNRAVMRVSPVQKVSASDFDSKNIANAPVLFYVTAYLASTPKDLHIELSVDGAKYGHIATASKDIKGQNVTPFEFTNKSFDKVDINKTNKDFAEKVINTGYLPADNYTYTIKIFENGALIAEATGNQYITDLTTTITLISPGSILGSTPFISVSRNPNFQWYSQSNSSFDINLYEVLPGQRSASEVSSRRPIFTQQGITTMAFAYPTSARALEEGKVYAWVVTGHVRGTSGDQETRSDMFWFNIGKPNPQTQQVSTVEISPKEIDLEVNDTITFRSKAYDEKGQIIKGIISPEWKVTPVSGDRIDRNGKFTAGSKPANIAVIVRYGNVTDYAVIRVKNSAAKMDMNDFFAKVFGLPKN